MCVDFTDVNKACPKDSFSLPRIDQLVDSTDAYSGYNQIRMDPEQEEHTSFMTDQGTYCYKMMPFGLKNVGATYQCLVNKMFEAQIGRNVEVYVGDMLVASPRQPRFIVSQRGIKPTRRRSTPSSTNPPRTIKEILRRPRRIAALSRFLAKSREILALLEALRGTKSRGSSGVKNVEAFKESRLTSPVAPL
ncbi:hypothetical protein Nepgr_033100 [Nepenthes gracilis]|uniref:Reverse transcriptase domain-containing protein n=1 Tax=Nepenthes gracilis TaxID=150966 RepID=A0AAD3Y6B6_NEPGR|nr:hypothetical protein Nepgr_033100 [Nepenthes gracilis]